MWRDKLAATSLWLKPSPAFAIVSHLWLKVGGRWSVAGGVKHPSLPAIHCIRPAHSTRGRLGFRPSRASWRNGKMAPPRVYKNYVNGEWVTSASGHTFDNINPANTHELVGIFQKSNQQDVDYAIQAAKEAYKSWRLTPPPKRGEILYRAARLLVERKEAYAEQMTREMGKILEETRGDVQEAIDMTYYMAGEGRRLFGQTTPSELPDKFAMSVRQSIGVCGMITPWNFPMAIPSWKMTPALISGNTVVLKPAEDTPLSSYHLVQVLTEAGIPPGVVNIVSGD